MENKSKIIVQVRDGRRSHYTLEIGPQVASYNKIKYHIRHIESRSDFISGRMRQDDVVSYLEMVGIHAKVLWDVSVMYINPKNVLKRGDRLKDEEMDRALKIVCEYFGVTVDDVISKKRKGKIMEARRMFCYIAKNMFSECRLKDVKDKLNLVAHGTAIHHIKTIEFELGVGNRLTRQQVEEIEKLIDEQLIQEQHVDSDGNI